MCISLLLSVCCLSAIFSLVSIRSRVHRGPNFRPRYSQLFPPASWRGGGGRGRGVGELQVHMPDGRCNPETHLGIFWFLAERVWIHRPVHLEFHPSFPLFLDWFTITQMLYQVKYIRLFISASWQLVKRDDLEQVWGQIVMVSQLGQTISKPQLLLDVSQSGLVRKREWTGFMGSQGSLTITALD